MGQLMPSSLGPSPDKSSDELFKNRLGQARALALFSKNTTSGLGLRARAWARSTSMMIHLLVPTCASCAPIGLLHFKQLGGLLSLILVITTDHDFAPVSTLWENSQSLTNPCVVKHLGSRS